MISLFFSISFFICQKTFKAEQDHYPRVHQARINCEQNIIAMFQNKNIDYPPAKILLIAFKQEKFLQLWAQANTGQYFVYIKEYNFTDFSGTLGPKRRQGDLQIPEGFYYIDDFNPYSNFHLSLSINYPNRADSILGIKNNLGGEIRIHGSNVTIGCIPIGNQAIEELYITCVDVKSQGQEKIPVYIFPCQMNQNNWSQLKPLTTRDSSLLVFWNNIKQGYDLFIKFKKELDYKINNLGQYIFTRENPYLWLKTYPVQYRLCNVIQPPPNYERTELLTNTFAYWLRSLPLKPGNPPVCLFNAQPKAYQNGHYAVVDINTGSKNLQQCADVIIRLYAEYLFAKKQFDKINFMLTNGVFVNFRKWINGLRPRVNGNTVTWHKQAAIDSSRKTLIDYLQFIFMYAGTYSLNKQLTKEVSINEIKPGDIIIQPGFPGHAVLVLDMAKNTTSNEKVFLLSQGFMPAQDFHILKNFNDPTLSPWYKIDRSHSLSTPEWRFTDYTIKRF